MLPAKMGSAGVSRPEAGACPMCQDTSGKPPPHTGSPQGAQAPTQARSSRPCRQPPSGDTECRGPGTPPAPHNPGQAAPRPSPGLPPLTAPNPPPPSLPGVECGPPGCSSTHSSPGRGRESHAGHQGTTREGRRQAGWGGVGSGHRAGLWGLGQQPGHPRPSTDRLPQRLPPGHAGDGAGGRPPAGRQPHARRAAWNPKQAGAAAGKNQHFPRALGGG